MKLQPYDPRLKPDYPIHIGKPHRQATSASHIGKMEFTWDDDHHTVVCETPRYVSVCTALDGPTMIWRRFEKDRNRYVPHQGAKECERRRKKLSITS